jgi:nitroreductase
MTRQVNPAETAFAGPDPIWHNNAAKKRSGMDIPVERWYPAIFERRSRRVYLAGSPAEDSLSRLDQVCREFRPFPEARVRLVRSSPEAVFKGLIGGYGRVSGASMYLAFLGQMSSLRVQEAAGYTGEGLILEATALGLATCWVGGFFRPEEVRSHIALEKGERVLSVTPIGYAPSEKTGQEKLMSGLVGARSRRPLSELVRGEATAPWMVKALEAARLAPSARNRQPWRFRIEGGAIVISVNRAPSFSSISKRLDCGIAMLHFELGALAAGARGHWDALPAPDVARFIL